MIQLQNISLTLGGKVIYRDLNLTLNSGVKYGLIGDNGSGKTSLFRLLTGELEADDGKIIKPKDTVIGYLPQDAMAFGEQTVWSIAKEAFQEIEAIKEEISVLELRLEKSDSQEITGELLEKIHGKYERLNWLNAHNAEAEIEKVLSGLGFKEDDFTRKIGEFSGGWQMRAFLAKLLLLDPDFLLLDEPTNHLDIISLQWLEDFLRSYPGTVMLITHDRYFIDKLCRKILHMEGESVKEYDAPYEKFVEAREESYIRQKAEYENQQQKIKELERFIERFRYKATKARQVQSRIKELEKMEKVALPQRREQNISFCFPLSRRSFKNVFALKELWFKYDEEWIIKNLEFNVFRGEKIAVIGPNGAGKTTLLKLLAGILEPDKGILERGGNLDVGFYAQHQLEQLNIGNTVFDEVMGVAGDETIGSVRSVLGAFLFHDEEQQKVISVLSGGEKARVALAKILVQPFNCLIMDEPTNHLDMQSREILLDALLRYEGTVIIVSHDRKFVDNFAKKTVYISSEHEVKEYPGNYSDFMNHFGMFTQGSAEKEKSNLQQEEMKTGKDGAELSYRERKEINRKREKLQKTVIALEGEIEQLQREKKAMESKLAESAGLTVSEISEIGENLHKISKKIELINDKWIEQMDKLERLDILVNK